MEEVGTNNSGFVPGLLLLWNSKKKKRSKERNKTKIGKRVINLNCNFYILINKLSENRSKFLV